MTPKQLDSVSKSFKRWTGLGILVALVVLPLLTAGIEREVRDLGRAQRLLAVTLVQNAIFTSALEWRSENPNVVGKEATNEEQRLIYKSLGGNRTRASGPRPQLGDWADRSIEFEEAEWSDRVILRVSDVYLREGVTLEFQVIVDIPEPAPVRRRFRFFQQNLNASNQLTWWMQELPPQVGDDPMSLHNSSYGAPQPMSLDRFWTLDQEIIDICGRHGAKGIHGLQAVSALRQDLTSHSLGDHEASIPGTSMKLPFDIALPVLALIAVVAPVFAGRATTILLRNTKIEPESEVLPFIAFNIENGEQSTVQSVERWTVASLWAIAAGIVPIGTLALASFSLSPQQYGTSAMLWASWILGVLAVLITPVGIWNVARVMGWAPKSSDQHSDKHSHGTR
ncbi:MAG: hypothetical protein ACTS3F_12290 [Phycisphaerales bacterium]